MNLSDDLPDLSSAADRVSSAPAAAAAVDKCRIAPHTSADASLPTTAVRGGTPKSRAPALRAAAAVRDAGASQLIVNFLPPRYDDAALAALFATVAPVRGAAVQRHADTGMSKCFGFVHMASVDGAAAAALTFSGVALLGKRLRISPARLQDAVLPCANGPAEEATPPPPPAPTTSADRRPAGAPVRLHRHGRHQQHQDYHRYRHRQTPSLPQQLPPPPLFSMEVVPPVALPDPLPAALAHRALLSAPQPHTVLTMPLQPVGRGQTTMASVPALAAKPPDACPSTVELQPPPPKLADIMQGVLSPQFSMAPTIPAARSMLLGSIPQSPLASFPAGPLAAPSLLGTLSLLPMPPVTGLRPLPSDALMPMAAQ